MSTPGHDQLDPQKREEAIIALKDYLRGGGRRKSLVEEQESLACTTLKGEVEEKIKTATPQAQTDLHFKLALYRALTYSTASSYYCRSLSYSNELRQLYEGQRLLLMSPQT